MEIEYELTTEDMMRLNMFHAAHSPTVRHSGQMTTLAGAVLIPLVGFIIYAFERKLSVLVVFVLIDILWIGIGPAWWRWELNRRLKRMLVEGHTPGSTDRCTLTIEPNGIITRTGKVETSLHWDAVEKIVECDTDTIIYVGPMSAIMIPGKAFGSASERQKFLQAVHQFRDAADSLLAG